MADKDFKTIEEQIEILRSRGLSIEDEAEAKDFLLHSKCTVRTLGSNVTIQMVGSVFVLYCEIPTRQ